MAHERSPFYPTPNKNLKVFHRLRKTLRRASSHDETTFFIIGAGQTMPKTPTAPDADWTRRFKATSAYDVTEIDRENNRGKQNAERSRRARPLKTLSAAPTPQWRWCAGARKRR